MTILTAPAPLLAGPPGQSAYAMAVALGLFQGSPAAFILWLQGSNGVGLPGGAGAAGPGVTSVPQVFSGNGTLNPATTYAGVGGTLGAIPSGGITLALCLAAVKNRGDSVTIADETGTCSVANPINIIPNAGGSDTISGQVGVQLTIPYQRITLVANSSNLWLSP